MSLIVALQLITIVLLLCAVAYLVGVHDSVRWRLGLVHHRLERIKEIIMSALDDLKAEVAEQTTVEQGVVTLLDRLATELQNALNNGSTADIQAIVTQLKNNRDAYTAAVTRNTPVADAGGAAGLDPQPGSTTTGNASTGQSTGTDTQTGSETGTAPTGTDSTSTSDAASGSAPDAAGGTGQSDAGSAPAASTDAGNGGTT